MKHLNYEERKCIEKMCKEGLKVREMARILKRSHSTISEEISRNKQVYDKWYDAETAHERFLKRQNNKGNIRKLDNDAELKEMVINNLHEDFSPEQTAGLIKLIGEKKISHETIYQFIYSEEGRRLKLWLKLRHRKYPRRQKHGIRKTKYKVTIKERVSIKYRPESANKKLEIGHIETDTIIFSKQKKVVSVQADRKTQKCAITILENKTAEETKYALRRAIEDEYGSINVKTITHDNGTENAKHMEIRDEYQIATYFCRPYASWQKGLVENINKLIRQYLPRNMNIMNLTQDDMNTIQDKLNNRPRKSLKYLTPNQAYQIFLQGGRIRA
jgi:transposase, IS30 family